MAFEPGRLQEGDSRRTLEFLYAGCVSRDLNEADKRDRYQPKCGRCLIRNGNKDKPSINLQQHFQTAVQLGGFPVDRL